MSDQDVQGIYPLARDGVHEKIIAFLADRPRGRILDVPTGLGALAKRLHEIGFAVSCCDIEPSQFMAKGLTVERGDLNGRLPYRDEEFDYVCFLEAIEHTENPYNAVREVARVLKRGGLLAMSTPNYLNIERRMKGKTYGMHLSPIGYTLIRFALESAGLKIVKMTYDLRKPKIIFLKPLVWFIRAYTKLWPKAKQEEYWFHDTTSSVILEGGNTLIIIAEKA
jgi:2-polyprenyl-3-methyl-5-hydroxy-6-metoxy-1,4-benzoquinol methylase